jgi:hypothetical protein
MARVIYRGVKGNLYLIGVVAYRRKTDGKATSSSLTIGRVDNITHQPIYNDKFLPWCNKYGVNQDTALKDYLNKNNKN